MTMIIIEFAFKFNHNPSKIPFSRCEFNLHVRRKMHSSNRFRGNFFHDLLEETDWKQNRLQVRNMANRKDDTENVDDE